MNISASNRALARASLASLALTLVAAWFATPGKSAWLPACPFYRLIRLYCPGCGTTRMLSALVHGHPIEAFEDNALTLLILPILLYGLLRASTTFYLPALPRLSRHRLTVLTLVIILFTVARNVPSEPFRRLAPSEAHQIVLRALSSPHMLCDLHISHI